MTVKNKKILFIGGGKMGSAIANAASNLVTASNISVIDPFINEENFSEEINSGSQFYSEFSELNGKNFDVVIIAIKPQHFEDILPLYESFSGDTIFVSIAAGRKISAIKKSIGEDKKIIRSMPNLPATIGQGVTGIFADENISKEDSDLVKQIFATCGAVIEFNEEDGLDTITAISGSAPGYIFYMMEAFQNNIEKLGFSTKEAEEIVLNNFSGTVALAKQSGKSFKELKEAVTSKAGTTEAGLNALSTENVLENLFSNAIKSAHNRAKELAG